MRFYRAKPLRALGIWAVLLLLGSVVAVSASTVKGGQSTAGSDAVLVKQRIDHLKTSGRLFNEVARSVTKGDASSSSQRYGRWLRVNSARMKELGLRWSSRLQRGGMATRERAELNDDYHLQCDQLQQQLTSEHQQFSDLATVFPKEFKRIQRAIDQLE